MNTISTHDSSGKFLVAFAHGKESGPWGRKISKMADVARNFGADVISPDYTSIPNPDDRVDYLLSLPEIKGYANSDLILVGSSMGGYVTLMASCELNPAGIFLLAPAIGISGYSEPLPGSGAGITEIVMGWSDDVIPPANVIAFASANKARLHMLDSDHRLESVLPEISELFGLFLKRIR